MFDVITVGSATQDVFVQTDAGRIFSLLGPEAREEFLGFPYGAKVNVSEVLFMTGGGATNAAVSFAKQGLRCAIIAIVGEDDAGEKVRGRLGRDGVDLSLMVSSADHGTAYSVVLTSFEGDRTVLVYRGASDHLEPGAIDLARLAQTKWLYVSSLGASGPRVYGPLFEAARRADVRIAFNPGNAVVTAGLSANAALLEGLDVLLLNREEALTFLGRDTRLRRQSPEAEDALYTEMLRALQAAGVKLPVITDGFRGAYALRDNTRVRCPACRVEKVVSTLGAGDAFGSTLIAGLLRHDDDLVTALREASINAAHVISVFGAKRGLLDAAALVCRTCEPVPDDEAPRSTVVG